MSGLVRAVALETVAAIASAISRVRAVVLLYHSVSDVPFDLAVPTRMFGEQMRFLTDHFELLTVTELLIRLSQSAEHSHPAKNAGWSTYPLAALTFDDGYADNFDQVLPILATYHVRATFYPITDLLSQHRSVPAQNADHTDSAGRCSPRATSVLHPASRAGKLLREGSRPEQGWSVDRHGQEVQMLSWEQLRQMAGQGHEIGAHTVHHPKLHQLPVEDIRREVLQCKSDLEARLNVPVESFAYPRGRYTPVVKEIVRAAGFTSAVTIHERTVGAVFDPFEVPRIPVQPDTSLAAFKARTTAAIDWYSRLRRWRRGA
jgi:peptidoglycan/xylan/chitin deacetylase (PgdA/CDA1 family)